MQAWEDFLLEQEKEFGKHTVQKWARTLKLLRFDACNIYLEAADSFQLTWIEEYIIPRAKRALKNNNGHEIKIHLSSPEVTPNSDAPSSKESAPQMTQLLFESDPIHPHCNFEQFIPPPESRIPFQVLCRLMGFNPKTGSYEAPPAEIFNPIYLYGPSGVGKTHLLMAAATFLQLRGLKVFYVRAESFTDHVVNAIRAGKMQGFRKAYRGVDVLIIDDVQVFGRKNATQEELFHTFNTLHTAGKQIILSANCNPRLLEYVEERLISRFEWGLTLAFEKTSSTEILEPLLASRCKQYHLALRKNLSEYLLKNFTTPSNLSKAIESIAVHGQNVALLELSHVESLLERLIHYENQNTLTSDHVLTLVAESFGIKVEDILSKSQSRDAVLPRQIAMYLLRKELNLPFMKIGSIFHRDHSTVMSSIKQITKALSAKDNDTTYHLTQLQTSLNKKP